MKLLKIFVLPIITRQINTISITDGINTEIIPIITANETPLNVASEERSEAKK